MSEVIQRTKEEVEQIASSLGLVCILPRDRELMLDIDSPTWKLDPKLNQVLSDNGLRISNPLKVFSKSKHLHVYYEVSRPLTHHERILLQALLGSDSTRELLSMLRLSEGSEAPTALFETAIGAKRVAAWRKAIDSVEAIQF